MQYDRLKKWILKTYISTSLTARVFLATNLKHFL